jgi:O-antigen/teichoic acid export membrane protein
VSNDALPQDVLTPAEVAADYMAASDAHRSERGRRLKLSVVSALLTKPLALIVPIITVRLFLQYLGEERYGLYQAIGAVALWFGLTNAGLGMGLINRLADCYVSNDRELAQRYVSSIVIALGAIMLGVTLLLGLITPFVDWNGFFNVRDPLALRETALAVFVAGAVTLVGIWLSVTNCIYTAYQEMHRGNLWDATARIVMLGACVAIVYTSWGLVGVILAASGAALVVRAVNMGWLFAVEKPWLRPRLRSFDFTLLKRVAAEGICFFVLQMAVMALFQTDKVIISARLDPAEVTPYSTYGQVFISGYGLFMLMLSPLWPAHAEALRRGDIAWVKRMLRWSLLAGCGTILLVGALLLVAGKPLVRMWVGRDIGYSSSLIVALTLLFALRAWVDCRSVILNSARVLVPQMVFFAAHAISNIILALILAKRWGAEGVAWATVITSLFTSAWGYPWMIRKYVWKQPDRFLVPPS